MLKTRIVTALLLVLILIPLLYFAPLNIIRFIALAIFSMAAWEWARISKLSNVYSIGYAFSVFIIGVLISLPRITVLLDIQGINVFILLAILLWFTYVPLQLIYVSYVTKREGIPPSPLTLFQLVLGCIFLLSAWLSFVQLRGIGFFVLMSVLFLVWFADVFAYFFGKYLGRIKVAPYVSPNKTLEGVVGALLGGLVCVYLFMTLLEIPNNYFFFLSKMISVQQIYLLALCLVTLAIMGDLYESALKRMGDVKDSSNLLPGHGGILDRIDALLPVLPVAYVAYLIPSYLP